MGRQYRIKSKSRFIIFVALTIILSVMFTNTLLGLNDARSFTEQEYIVIEVMYGDTLWNIAQTYMQGYGDIRRAVHELRRINDIAAHELKAGQVLKVPVFQ